MKKQYIKTVLFFVIAVNTAGVIIGCSHKPQAKGYVCVEKSPIKITYIDYHKEITPNTVRDIVNQAHEFPYKNQKMNENNNVIISYDAKVTHTSTMSNTGDIK